MDADANKHLVTRFYEEVWARGNVGFATEVLADNYESLAIRLAKRKLDSAALPRHASSAEEAKEG